MYRLQSQGNSDGGAPGRKAPSLSQPKGDSAAQTWLRCRSGVVLMPLPSCVHSAAGQEMECRTKWLAGRNTRTHRQQQAPTRWRPTHSQREQKDVHDKRHFCEESRVVACPVGDGGAEQGYAAVEELALPGASCPRFRHRKQPAVGRLPRLRRRRRHRRRSLAQDLMRTQAGLAQPRQRQGDCTKREGGSVGDFRVRGGVGRLSLPARSNSSGSTRLRSGPSGLAPPGPGGRQAGPSPCRR